jgi:hypothetical protein
MNIKGKMRNTKLIFVNSVPHKHAVSITTVDALLPKSQQFKQSICSGGNVTPNTTLKVTAV